MWISGAGMTPFRVLRFNSKPKTIPAIKWIQVADKNWKNVNFYGDEAEIDNIIDQFENNRQNGANFFNIMQFNGVDDQLFGANIDYSSDLDVTVIEWKKRKQKQFKTFTLSVLLQLTEDPYIYNATAAQLPTLRPLIGYVADSNWTLKKISTYDNTFTYIDYNTDSGIFEGIFLMNHVEITKFRKMLLSTTRGSYLGILGIQGVPNIFGTKRPTTPISTYWLDFQDQLINLNYWAIKIKLAEAI